MIRKLLASFVVITGVVTAAPAFAQDNTVNVLYAGSLVNLMERSVGPAFEKATGQHFRGYAAARTRSPTKSRANCGAATYSSAPARR